MLPPDPLIPWFENFVGIAYRYFEIRMNVVPLFSDLKKAQIFWREQVIGGTITRLRLDS